MSFDQLHLFRMSRVYWEMSQLDHHFVLSDWLKRECPKDVELIGMVEAHAQEALHETCQA